LPIKGQFEIDNITGECNVTDDQTYDYVIIGSGFGGSVSAMRLTEKGYRVLVLERGKRFRDEDFPKTNWNIWKFLWLPALRCFGIMQFSMLKDVLVLHGDGVGGGSLMYGNVLMEPDEKYFDQPDWKTVTDWKSAERRAKTVRKSKIHILAAKAQIEKAASIVGDAWLVADTTPRTVWLRITFFLLRSGVQKFGLNAKFATFILYLKINRAVPDTRLCTKKQQPGYINQNTR
jgi:voltage-gated potassium channel Kch